MPRVENGPWKYFFDALLENGNELVEIHQNPDVVVFLNGHRKLVKRLIERKKSLMKILIMWESMVTRPEDYDYENLERYDVIFSPSPLWLAGPKVHYFNWPASISEANLEDDMYFREDKVAFIASDKYSFVKGELYSLRRLYAFSNQKIIEVYGHNWGSHFTKLVLILKAARHYPFLGINRKRHNPFKDICQTPMNYKGVTNSKSVLTKYKYCLVIENQANYVSEKIFDAISNGCIPFYIGPDLELFGIDSSIVYELESSGNLPASLEEIIVKDRDRLEQIYLKGREFLKSKSIQKFNNDIVLSQLGQQVAKMANDWTSLTS